jgi:hypothetical protein
MRFRVDRELLRASALRLAQRPGIYWVVGGACSGKSTMCRMLASRYGLGIYDVDAHTWDDYPGRCAPDRHPALSEWFGAPDPFSWMLRLPARDFARFNRAATVETMDLIAEDLVAGSQEGLMLVDGGLTNPGLLAQAVPAHRIACLEIPPALSARIWLEAPERRFMVEMVRALPDADAAWLRFLGCDRQITAAIRRECRAAGIRIYRRDAAETPERQAAAVAAGMGLAAVTTSA